MNTKRNPRLVPYSQKLRKNMTPEEKHLWYDFLKSLPVTVQRQKIIGPYIVDFSIANPPFIIELDGSQHAEEENAERDAVRDAFLQELGYTVLRYTNYQIKTTFRDVCEDIYRRVLPEDD